MSIEEKEDKLAAGEITERSRFSLWMENFWYHYKFQAIVVMAAIFIFAVCFVQCTQRETGDLTVSFAGPYVLEGDEREGVLDVLNAVAPRTEEGGERLSVILSTYPIYNEEELRALYTDPETGICDESGYQTAKGYNADRLKNFGSYLMTGESAVLLVCPYVYEYQNVKEKLARPLSDLYGDNLPAASYDGYAIRLGDTELYRYYPALQVLPADTLLVLTQSYVWGASADESTYKDFEALFRALVDFKIPQ
ncbi:MAG: hypothetical protein IJX28_03025 [Clostridia bacterium]|nr:hypothetical protein [Clostridia bacterium]